MAAAPSNTTLTAVPVIKHMVGRVVRLLANALSFAVKAAFAETVLAEGTSGTSSRVKLSEDDFERLARYGNHALHSPIKLIIRPQSTKGKRSAWCIDQGRR